MSLRSWHNTVANSIREIVFGLEDSLVSTLGTLTGIAAGAGSTYIVLLSGLVLVAVEATSMAAGSYLSSKSAAQADPDARHHASHETPTRAALVMFCFYLLGGTVPVVPYLFFPVDQASLVSIGLTGIVLFWVGAWSASYTKRSAWRSGVEMLLVSFGAAVIGYLIGRWFSSQFGIRVIG